MAYEVFLGDKQGLEDRLNGARVLGPFPSDGLPIGGLTLIIGATTITFSGAAGAYLTIDEIIDEINVGIPGLAKRRSMNIGPHTTSRRGDGKVVPKVGIVLAQTAGYTLDKDGTANVLLGIDTAADTVVTGAVALAKIAGFSVGLTAGHYALIIDLS